MLPQLFSYEGQQLRTVVKDGEPWFVASDVCAVLEIANSRDAVARIKESWKDAVGITDTIGRNQTMTVISEPGIWKLAFTSRKAEAEKFTDWVAEEVIPSIRKTGTYSLKPKLPQTYAEALRELAATWEENQRLLPKAQYFDALVDRNLLTNFRDTAKELHIKERDFIQWLTQKKYIYKDAKGKNKPYAQYVPELFEIKEQTKDKWAGTQTLITPRGRETFRLLLQRRDKTNETRHQLKIRHHL